MLAIYKRELRAYFTSPIGYVVIAACWFFGGWNFTDLYSNGYPQISYVFDSLFLIILFIVPILTMRLISDDRRMKTDQILLTSPVRITGIIMGKFLSAFTIYATGLSCTFIFQMIFASNVDNAGWMQYWGSLSGTLFFGAALIAIGLFISSMTESQVVAAVMSFAVSLFMLMMNWAAVEIDIGFLGERINGWLTAAIRWMSVQDRYTEFTKGIFNYSNILFFLSLSVMFLFFAVRSMDKKRFV